MLGLSHQSVRAGEPADRVRVSDGSGGGAESRSAAAVGAEGIRRAAAGIRAYARDGADHPALRAPAQLAVQTRAPARVRRAAEDGFRQDSPRGVARHGITTLAGDAAPAGVLGG